MARKKLRIPERRSAGKGKSPKVVRAWAGFVDGKLYGWLSGFYGVEHLSVFEYRADAERCHEDVRRVTIHIDPSKNKKAAAPRIGTTAVREVRRT